MALLVKTVHRSSRFIDNLTFKLCVRNFQISSSLQLNHTWRFRNGLTENPNTYGPLTNLPDYTFKDGRPTPVGMRHRTRLEKQQEYAAKIVKLMAEIDFAVNRYDEMKRNEEERKKDILDRKLKPKGSLLNAK